jgi:L-lactate dehydrogenase
LAILVECLTQGLGGFGRAEQPTQWGAAILVLAAAPGAFAGAHHFIRETNWISAACRAAPPVTGGDPVRLPGQLALARKREALKSGVLLHPSVEKSLAKLASALAVKLPRPLS